MPRKWKTEKEKREIFGEDKYLVSGSKKKRRRKRGKYLEKTNIWLEEAKKSGEGNGEIFGEDKYFVSGSKEKRRMKRGKYLEKNNIW